MDITPTQMKALQQMISSEYDGVTEPWSCWRPATIGNLVKAGLVSAERKSWGFDQKMGKWRMMTHAQDDTRVPDLVVWRVTDAGRALVQNA